jgi:hypothetical protein
VRQNLWAALEAEIHPSECEIYSFLGDSQDDPFSEPGTLWNFVYLIYNKKLKRVLLFTCQGLRYSRTQSDFDRVNGLHDVLKGPD